MGDEPEDDLRAAFGERKHTRLAQTKLRYDPDNMFRFKANIKPAATGGAAIDRDATRVGNKGSTTGPA